MTPDLAPAYDISIEDQGTKKIEPLLLGDRCVAFSFEDNANLADELSLTLDNGDLSLFDDDRFRMHQHLTVAWGYRGRMTNRRRCKIVAMRGSTSLQIKAHGEALKLDQVPRPRVFENMTHSQVIKKIAAEHGFGGGEFIEDTKVVYPHIVQPAISDGKFIRRLANKHGFEFFVKGGILHFHRAKLEQQPKKEFVWRGGDGDWIDFSLDEEVHKGTGAVKSKGIDPITKKPYEAKASNEDTKRPGVGEVVIHVDQRTQQVKGYDPATVSETEAPSSATNKEAAKQHADGKFRTGAKKGIKMSITIVGDPDLGARDLIIISGIGRRLSGRWYIEKATTKIDGSGYIMNCELSRDAHNGYGKPKIDAKSKADPNKKDAPKDGDTKPEIYAIDQRTQTAIGWKAP